MSANEKNRSNIRNHLCLEVNSLLSLFLTYSKKTMPAAAASNKIKKTNQYFIPNDINAFSFLLKGCKYTQLLFNTMNYMYYYRAF